MNDHRMDAMNESIKRMDLALNNIVIPYLKENGLMPDNDDADANLKMAMCIVRTCNELFKKQLGALNTGELNEVLCVVKNRLRLSGKVTITP